IKQKIVNLDIFIKMDTIILCRFCNLVYDEPKFLPCGENICTECIRTVVDKLECIHCDQVHSIPANSFPDNKQLKNILNLTSKPYARYQEAKSEFKKFKKTYESGRHKIESYSKELIQEINFKISLKLKELSNCKNELISQVDDYEKECLSYFEANQETIMDQKFSFIINRVEEEIKNRSLISEENLQIIEKLKNDIITSHNELNEAIFNGNYLTYEDPNYNYNLAGTLKTQKRKCYDRKKLSSIHLIDYSNSYPLDQTLIRVACLKNGNFAICYIRETSLKLIVEIHDFKHRSLLNFFEYSFKGNYNSILKSYENVIVLAEINSKYLVVFDLFLNKLVEKTFKFNLSSLFCFQQFIGVIDNTREENKSFIYILDNDLNNLLTIENDAMSLSFPHPIEYCFASENYIFFREKEFLNVLNNSASLVSRLNFPKELKLIGVNVDYLMVWNRKDKCIVHMDLKGNECEKIDLINFNENNLEILYENESKRLVFVDVKKWNILKA
ncbi:unnamed protein product, partial [Brachionus calyciflorus]